MTTARLRRKRARRKDQNRGNGKQSAHRPRQKPTIAGPPPRSCPTSSASYGKPPSRRIWTRLGAADTSRPRCERSRRLAVCRMTGTSVARLPRSSRTCQGAPAPHRSTSPSRRSPKRGPKAWISTSTTRSCGPHSHGPPLPAHRVASGRHPELPDERVVAGVTCSSATLFRAESFRPGGRKRTPAESKATRRRADPATPPRTDSRATLNVAS